MNGGVTANSGASLAKMQFRQASDGRINLPPLVPTVKLNYQTPTSAPRTSTALSTRTILL